MAEKFNIVQTAYPVRTPLPTEELVLYEGIATFKQIHHYQQLVGSINYAATITRADISKATSKLSKFLQNPSPKHIASAERCLHYLVDSKYLASEYNGKIDQEEIFLTYRDSAFANDKSTYTSSFGFNILLYSGIIDFKAIKSKTVTTSSTKAELLALSFVAKVFLRWLRLFENIGFYLNFKPKILCNNVQTIRILTKEAPKLKTALKHVNIHQS